MARGIFHAVGKTTIVAFGATTFMALAASAQTPAEPQTDQPTAAATFVDLQGKEVGTATLTETPHGVLIRAELEGLEPGERSLHIHEVGTCEPATKFESAGAHFNPHGAEHGFMVQDGPHAGDIPNQFVGEDGKLSVNVLAAMISIGASDVENKDRSSVLDADGSAIVIHAGADDYASQPSGKAGDRVVCGVIEAAPK